jgi:hypothetical protein
MLAIARKPQTFAPGGAVVGSGGGNEVDGVGEPLDVQPVTNAATRTAASTAGRRRPNA